MKNFNDVLLYRYQIYSTQADGVEPRTLEGRAYSLEFLVNHSPNLKKLSPAKAISFKKQLKQEKVNGKLLTLKRQRRILGNIRGFLTWLSQQPGYKSVITTDLISYYSLSRKENRLANLSERRDFPTLEHVLRLLRSLK